MTKLKNIFTEELDSFVSFIDNDCHGSLSDPKLQEKFLPMSLIFKTSIDESVDPFGDKYFQSQLALYEEIAGRHLDQWSGELHPVSVDELIKSPNPQGITDVNFVSENVRAISTMLSLSSLGNDAHILDMGAGHGLSSEIYAFCGCHVDAIDIDINLSELAMKRAEQRSLSITRSVLNFDSLSSLKNDYYDAAFFFQSLHHALRPWDLIAELKIKISRNGVLAFCGEPIQNNHWKHWGIRLDEESVYVARKYGWFESGWSREFINECFNRNGLKLVLLEGGHQGGIIGITSKNINKLDEIINKATKLGFSHVTADEFEPAVQNYHSQIGELSINKLSSFIRTTSRHSGGYLCFGPYISLPTGSYRVSFVIKSLVYDESTRPLSFLFDIISNRGKDTHYKDVFILGNHETIKLVNAEFELSAPADSVEARVYISENNEMWETSFPIFEKISSTTQKSITPNWFSPRQTK